MNFRLVFLLWLLNSSSAQDAGCDFRQRIPVGDTLYVNSPYYPNSYTPSILCRWSAVCPAGYNCRLDCPDIRIPNSDNCQMDRLLVSKTGDPLLNAADAYCGTRSISVTSTYQSLTIGLVAARNSSGGRFLCTVTTQAVVRLGVVEKN